MDTYTLTTGVEVPTVLVNSTMLALKDLLVVWPISFYEIVMKSRYPDHQWFEGSIKRCKQLGLVNDLGEVHSGVRDIILAAVVGEDLNMRLVDPVRKLHDHRT